jgi:quercetin dioxygenase-like cupin family protein
MTDDVRKIQMAPTRSIIPNVIDAAGRGIVPAISLHTAAMPLLYDFSAQPIEQMSPLIHRQYLHGTQSTFVKWIMKKGALVPLHHHVYEQITWITEGQAEVFSQGRRYIMNAGDMMFIPPNVPHEFNFLEDTIDIDIFTPQRQDWIDGTANYYAEADRQSTPARLGALAVRPARRAPQQ